MKLNEHWSEHCQAFMYTVFDLIAFWQTSTAMIIEIL